MSSEDREYKKSDNHERADKTALRQEIIEGIPDNESSKDPQEEGHEGPWPELCQERQDPAGPPLLVTMMLL